MSEPRLARIAIRGEQPRVSHLSRDPDVSRQNKQERFSKRNAPTNVYKWRRDGKRRVPFLTHDSQGGRRWRDDVLISEVRSAKRVSPASSLETTPHQSSGNRPSPRRTASTSRDRNSHAIPPQMVIAFFFFLFFFSPTNLPGMQAWDTLSSHACRRRRLIALPALTRIEKIVHVRN